MHLKGRVDAVFILPYNLKHTEGRRGINLTEMDVIKAKCIKS